MEQIRLSFIPASKAGKITWVMPVHNSVADVIIHLPKIRQAYPKSKIILIHDGDDHRSQYLDIAKAYNARVIGGEHLFELQTADKFLLRMLRGEDGLATFFDTSYIVRIDPDAMVNRKFNVMPNFSSMFGTLEGKSAYYNDDINGPPNIQGGVLGMTSDVAHEMTQYLLKRGNVFLDGHWARCLDAREMFNKGRFSDDFALSWLASILGVPLISHPEIRSNWTTVPINDRNQFAVTHPRTQKNFPHDTYKKY